MKTALFILDNNFPGDVRVDKEIAALSNICQVIVICRKGGRNELLPNVKIIEIPLIKNKVCRGVFDSLNALFWIHLPLFFILLRVILLNKIQIVHIHDLPLCSTAFLLMPNKTKLIDFHENYPEAIESWFEHRKNPIIRLKNSILFKYKRWKIYEKRMIKKADWVITVVDEMTQKFISEGVPENKILTICNFESKKFLKINTKIFFIEELPLIQKSLFYIGNFGPHRGLDDVIMALNYLANRGVFLNFIVAGIPNNPDTQKWLEKLIFDLHLASQIKFIGAVPASSYNFLLGNAYINIIPHKSNGHTENTIPHKLFQSFFSRKPLIVSSCAPLKRYVENIDAGAVYRANDPIDLAKTIQNIVLNYELYSVKAERAFEFCYNSNINWDHEGWRLAKFYNNI